MKCDVCKVREATIYLTQIVESKMQKVNLCEKCAEEKGVTDPTGFALADVLEGLGEETVTEKPLPPGELVCEACGFSQSDFKKTGRFGCAKCYEVFCDGLEGLLEAMHKDTEHHGKVPKRYEAMKSYRDRLDDLRSNLSASVEAEDYEEAARLRDAIAELEAGGGQPANPEQN